MPGMVASWRHAHRAESQRLRAAFPGHKGKHPYDILFGDRECTAFVGPFTATFTCPLELCDGTVIEPIGNAFEVVFSTVARPEPPRRKEA